MLAGALLGVVANGAARAAEAAKAPAGTGGSRTVPTGRAVSGARGVLPDPVLLDGSKHVAEKKSEFGMIGDFELPGDENNRNGKVGGGSGQPSSEQGDGGGAMPQGKGGGASQGAQTAKAGGAAGAPENAGGQDARTGDKTGTGDPNARAEGIRVAELTGEPSGGAGQAGGDKPAPVAIGDKAMRIPQQTPNVAVVGAQQVSNQNTQVYEKATGTGGKGPAGSQGPNRTEKGRAIPAGL